MDHSSSPCSGQGAFEMDAPISIGVVTCQKQRGCNSNLPGANEASLPQHRAYNSAGTHYSMYMLRVSMKCALPTGPWSPCNKLSTGQHCHCSSVQDRLQGLHRQILDGSMRSGTHAALFPLKVPAHVLVSKVPVVSWWDAQGLCIKHLVPVIDGQLRLSLR